MFKEAESVINSKICDEVLIFGLWNEGLPKEEQYSLQIVILKRIHVVCSSLPKTFFSQLNILNGV